MLSRRITRSDWRRWFVGTIYATHNKSPTITRALRKCLAYLKEGEMGLNIGAGFTELHPAVVNLDIALTPTIDCCAQAEHLPFSSHSFSVVLSQETLEHVREHCLAVREMYRVLKDGGTLYCQLPFVIGYHPGPTDFWRFSEEGTRELVEHSGFVCEEVGIAVGPAIGFYHIAVEFVAILLSRFLPWLYYPVKGLVALLLYPVKWLDPLLLKGEQADRIAGGYYVIARKSN
jgi:SAM-dependent methyltransferase